MRKSITIEAYRMAGAFEVIDGMFRIPHKSLFNYYYWVVCSTGADWDHVSVSMRITKDDKEYMLPRCPTWEEMCYIKELFFEDEETVIQIHPPKSEYVNCHPYCLHLWRPQVERLPLPDKELVGPQIKL